MSEMVEIIKRKHNNKIGYAWTKEILIEFGKDKLGEYTLCPTCFEDREVPIGEKFIKYQHQWNTLKKYHFNINGKTVNSYYLCEQCGFERIEKDTYADGKKGISIPRLRERLLHSAKYNWDFLTSKDAKYVGPMYRSEVIGEIKAYKEIYDLLGKTK